MGKGSHGCPHISPCSVHALYFLPAAFAFLSCPFQRCSMSKREIDKRIYGHILFLSIPTSYHGDLLNQMIDISITLIFTVLLFAVGTNCSADKSYKCLCKMVTSSADSEDSIIGNARKYCFTGFCILIFQKQRTTIPSRSWSPGTLLPRHPKQWLQSYDPLHHQRYSAELCSVKKSWLRQRSLPTPVLWDPFPTLPRFSLQSPGLLPFSPELSHIPCGPVLLNH